MAKPADVWAQVSSSPSNRVKVAVTDMDGVLRGKYLDKQKFHSVLEGGFGFCNVVLGWDSADVCYDDAAYTGWHSGYPDAQVQLDLSTFRHVPWDSNVPFFLGDFVTAEGAPLPICPRQTLKRVLARATKMGLRPLCSLEYEFFHFRETPETWAEKGHRAPQPLTPGMFGYSLVRLGQNRDYVHALFDEMATFRVPIEALHTETGPGVLEVALLYCDALEAADRAVLFKSGAKEIGHRFGIMPSFMAKWNAELPGCSGHIHQSLWDEERHNVFHDERDPRKMSATFRSYLAGQMLAMPDLLPMYAPTVNSYKRLVEGAWAPTKANWGVDNRTTALRAITGGAKSSRLETRVNGSDTNPYLSLAAAIASGLWGVEQNLTLKAEPVVGSGYADPHGVPLPRDLQEATARFSQSTLARELFGDAFVDHFATTRRWEWRQFAKAVTDWELKRYFEII